MYTVLGRDPVLAGIMERVGRYGLRVQPDGYRALIESVISQQLSGRAADGIIRRLHARYGGHPTPGQVAATPEEDLRGAGLSRMKASYIRGISAGVEDGSIDLRRLGGMSDGEVIGELTRIRGVGVWTAQMFLIFSLGRQDVLPTGDLGIRRGFGELYGVTGEADMIRVAEGWRPYRTAASWYLWRRSDGAA